DGLVSGTGEKLRVVYPGILSRSGPDFRDSVVTTDSGRWLKGDVEVHLRSSQWQAHGHHRDPAYNGVVLHLVFWDDEGKAALLENGERVPVLVVAKSWEVGDEPLPGGLPCQARAEDDEALGRILDEAGVERFYGQVTHLEQDMAAKEPSRVLYEGLMVALGYSQNKEAFMELAQRLPLGLLETLVKDKPPPQRVLILQALLLGTAGLLLASVVGMEWRQLREAWQTYGGGESMSQRRWRIAGVRPTNRPQRRLLGMGYLLARSLGKGLVGTLMELLDRASTPRSLAEGLKVIASGSEREPALIGWGRAAAMVVNVVLPFAAAWARLTSQSSLARQAEIVYRRHPLLEENEVTHHMRNQLGLGRGIIRTACRQQGLLHLYKVFCSQGSCLRCPLSGRSSEHKIRGNV
ncbi:MAG: DUF2851 family protein, partial [Chloroflexi bacterium]|nr:DUF2851 family protein [Chloroflexota bacterium]